MKLIKPSQISGEIMTLIEEADSRLIVISPYCNFSEWQKFLNTLQFLKRNNTSVEFYVRAGESKTIEEVKKIGFAPIEVSNLHAKLYINEKYAIVASMNLLTSSDRNSLDIAYKTETEKEYDELIDYYNRYLKIFNNAESQQKKNKYSNEKHIKYIKNGNWADYLNKLLSEELERNCSVKFDDATITIQCGNIYEAFISNSKKSNTLSVMGIISGKEFKMLNTELDTFKANSGLKVELNEGNENYYNQLWHHSKIHLRSSSLNQVDKLDYNPIVQILFDFVIALQDFKSHSRKSTLLKR